MNKLVVILLFLTSLSGFSKANEFVVTKQLDELWVDYNEDLSSFVPVNQGLFNKKKVAHLKLSNLGQSKFLVFQNISETQLFIGNKLFKVYDVAKQCVLPLSEVKAFIDDRNTILTFYSLKGELPLENIFIGEKKYGKLNKINRYEIHDRAYLSHVSVILFLLFSGGILAFIKSSKPSTYKAYFDVTMHFKNIEEHIIFNSFSKTAMLLPIIIAVLIAASLSLCGYSFFSSGFTTSSWLRLGLDTLIIMLFLFLKFFFLGFLSWVLSVRGLRRSHFFEFIRIATQYSVFLFLFTLFDLRTDDSNHTILLVLSLVFFLFLTVKLFSNLNREHKFSNLFLFFYFCSAEVFPLFVLVEQLTGSGI